MLSFVLFNLIIWGIERNQKHSCKMAGLACNSFVPTDHDTSDILRHLGMQP